MNEPLRAAAIVGLATVAAFVVFRGTSGGGSSAPRMPEDAVPAGAFVVADVDVDALRASPLGPALFGDKGRALGVGGVAEACGFDPLSRVKRAALSVPEEESDRGEFGVAARIEVTGEELQRCVARLSERRGGSAETREAGSFVVLDAPPAPAQPLPAPPSLHRRTTPSFAYGRGGLLLVGQGPWLEAMMRTADGKAPSTRSDPAHAALRTSLGGEGWTAPAVLVTMVLPRALRDRLRAEMAAEAGVPDPSAAAMGGVLGVASAGLAIRTLDQGARLEARADLVCDDEAACAAVEALLGKKRLEWSRDLALRVVGLGSVVDSVQLERTGARVRVRANADAAALAATLNRVLRLGGGFPARPSPAPPGPPPGAGGP